VLEQLVGRDVERGSDRAVEAIVAPADFGALGGRESLDYSGYETERLEPATLG
jgi:hypothetical protein